MKKHLLLSICSAAFIIVTVACFVPDDNTVMVQSKDTKLPNWQWTSGEVGRDNIAAKQAFTITFNSAIYQRGDSIKITFNSYKVSLSGITDITTFYRWSSRNILVATITASDKPVRTWAPLVRDTNARINKTFTGMNNNRTDSLLNYEIRTIVPFGFTMNVSVRPGSCELDSIHGHGKPMFTNGHPTLTTTVKGIEVEKL